MQKLVKRILRSLIESCGYRVIRRRDFYQRFVPYSRWGCEPIHFLRHFLDVSRIRTCVDVGANRGQTAAYFAAVFPQAVIHSFEPVQQTFSKLVCNTRDLAAVKPYNLGLGNLVTKASIRLSANDQMSSLIGSEEAEETETIQLTTLDAFMREQCVDTINLLKTDTEGYDLRVLEGAVGALSQKRIDLVYSEVGFDRQDKGHTYFGDLAEFLASYEFDFLGVYETSFSDNPVRVSHANALFGRRGAAVITPWVE